MSRFRIDLCTGFAKIGEAVAFSFDGTMSHLEAGTWTLSAPSQGIADTNPELVDSLVVRDSDTGQVVYAGAIRQGVNDARFVRTVDAGGYRYQWEGTDLFGMLASRVSYPNPGSEAPWNTAYDTNTGDASTVAANYVNDNYGPGALAARQVADVAIVDPGIGSTLTWEARLLNLAKLVGDICRAGGVSVDAIWDDTTGLAYTFRTRADLSTSIILTDQGDLEAATITKESPTTFIVGAGQGELTERTFRTAGTGATGFARVEALYDNTNIADGTSMQTAVDARLADLNGRLRVDAIVAPDTPNLPAWRTDYLLGDLLGVQIDGVRYAAPVTSVRFNVTADRQIVYPILGNSPGNDLTSLVRKVDGVAAAIDEATIERPGPGDLSAFTPTAATGWTVVPGGFFAYIDGRTLTWGVYVERTGATITASATGNITNTDVCTLATECRGTATEPTAATTLASGGPLFGTMRPSTGGVTLNAIGPSTSVANGATISLGGTAVLG